MIGIILLAFLTGGCLGVVGMAALAYGPKILLMRDNRLMKTRLHFLEDELEKRNQTVKDPRSVVHQLVN